MLCGLDEAGVGALMSDLVASAVILGENTDRTRLCDSKQISSERKRVEIAQHIQDTCMVGIGRTTHSEIDELGMAACRRLVFTRALDDLHSKYNTCPTEIIVDGTLFNPWRDIRYECIPKADATVPAVSAASIIAKTSRDKQVHDLCAMHPEEAARYGWVTNKGYPSKHHRDAIRLHGRSEHHRMSYKLKEETPPKKRKRVSKTA